MMYNLIIFHYINKYYYRVQALTFWHSDVMRGLLSLSATSSRHFQHTQHTAQNNYGKSLKPGSIQTQSLALRLNGNRDNLRPSYAAHIVVMIIESDDTEAHAMMWNIIQRKLAARLA